PNAPGGPTHGAVSVLAIDPNTGAVSPIAGSTRLTGPIPHGIAFTPDGRFAYVSNIDGTLSAYRIDPVSKLLTELPGSPFKVGSNVYPATVHPNGKFLYAYAIPSNSWVIQGFAIDPQTGALSALSAVPAIPNLQYGNLVFVAGGSCALATDWVQGTIS